MDQIIVRPEADEPPAIEAALGLGPKGRAPRRRRLGLYAVVALLAAGALYGGYRFLQPAPGPAFVTVPVERGDLTVEVSATGTLQPLIQVDISSELSGVVRSVSVTENQRVAKGDVLAELDTTPNSGPGRTGRGIGQGRRSQVGRCANDAAGNRAGLEPRQPAYRARHGDNPVA